jgi:hypothetical protein
VIRAGALLLALTATADAPETVYSAPAQHRLIEGVATDGQTLWLSSVLDRTILIRRAGADASITMPAGTLHPLGLAWDAHRNWLWVATDCPDLPGVAKCDSGALVALDRKGRLKANVSAGPGFHPGDVSAAGGAVFVSDGLNGAVYRLNGTTLDPLIAPGVARSAQGTALTADGKHLIVADYGRGVATVELETKVRTLLPMADGKPLRGLDGLVRVGADYYAIHNGSSPGSLIRFRINGAQIDVTVVQRGAPLADPTQLASDDRRLLVVADAGWPAASKPDQPSRGANTLVAFRLP